MKPCARKRSSTTFRPTNNTIDGLVPALLWVALPLLVTIFSNYYRQDRTRKFGPVSTNWFSHVQKYSTNWFIAGNVQKYTRATSNTLSEATNVPLRCHNPMEHITPNSFSHRSKKQNCYSLNYSKSIVCPPTTEYRPSTCSPSSGS